VVGVLHLVVVSIVRLDEFREDTTLSMVGLAGTHHEMFGLLHSNALWQQLIAMIEASSFEMAHSGLALMMDESGLLHEGLAVRRALASVVIHVLKRA